MAHPDYHYDESADNEIVFIDSLIQLIDSNRFDATDPFHAVSAIEEELGCPLALAR